MEPKLKLATEGATEAEPETDDEVTTELEMLPEEVRAEEATMWVEVKKEEAAESASENTTLLDASVGIKVEEAAVELDETAVAKSKDGDIGEHCLLNFFLR
jgi:hypothetical protein